MTDSAAQREQVEALLWSFLRDMEGVPLRRSRHNDLPSVSAMTEVENTANRIFALIKDESRPTDPRVDDPKDVEAVAWLTRVWHHEGEHGRAMALHLTQALGDRAGRRAARLGVATRPLARPDRQRVKPLTLWERFVLWLNWRTRRLDRGAGRDPKRENV